MNNNFILNNAFFLKILLVAILLIMLLIIKNISIKRNWKHKKLLLFLNPLLFGFMACDIFNFRYRQSRVFILSILWSHRYDYSVNSSFMDRLQMVCTQK